jgi:hypothetical protein
MQLEALLCDIRFSPQSSNPLWRQGHLRQRFGARYHHLPELGNRHYKTGGAIEIADMASGQAQVAALREATPALVLLCRCPDVTTCHRLVVANALAKTFAEDVVHLMPPQEAPHRCQLL